MIACNVEYWSLRSAGCWSSWTAALLTGCYDKSKEGDAVEEVGHDYPRLGERAAMGAGFVSATAMLVSQERTP